MSIDCRAAKGVGVFNVYLEKGRRGGSREAPEGGLTDVRYFEAINRERVAFAAIW